MTTVDGRRALIDYRARVLAFAEQPSRVNLERYLAASRRLEAARAKTPAQRRAA